jgi:hypothetical protein
MKEGKRNLKKGVISASAVAIGGILANSCETDLSDYNHVNGQYDALWQSSYLDKGEQFLNIKELQLSDKFKEYTCIMEILMDDVTNNETSAKLFCYNPNAYLSQKKIENIDVDLKQYLTERDKRGIMAFADKEIRDAAKQMTLSEFIHLCKSKRLLTTPVDVISKGYADYSRFFDSTEDYKAFLNQVASISGEDELKQMGDSCALVFIGAIRVAIINDDYVYDYQHLWGDMAPTIESSISDVIKEEPVFRFWIKEHDKTYIPPHLLFDELILQRSGEIAHAIVVEYPNYDEEKLKEFIALNLQNYYNFKSEN